MEEKKNENENENYSNILIASQFMITGAGIA